MTEINYRLFLACHSFIYKHVSWTNRQISSTIKLNFISSSSSWSLYFYMSSYFSLCFSIKSVSRNKSNSNENFVLFFQDSIVINCTVFVTIPERLPDRILGTIAIANSSDEEVYWSHVEFEQANRFPLNFIEVITSPLLSNSIAYLQITTWTV